MWLLIEEEFEVLSFSLTFEAIIVKNQEPIDSFKWGSSRKLLMLLHGLRGKHKKKNHELKN